MKEEEILRYAKLYEKFQTRGLNLREYEEFKNLQEKAFKELIEEAKKEREKK